MQNALLNRIFVLLIILSLLTACMPPDMDGGEGGDPAILETPAEEPTPTLSLPTPLPTREPYPPGTLVDYVAQTGDTLPALAVRFNTTVDEILAANPIIPADATTMPPGMPMQIPIYYQPLWGSPYQIIPDSLFVNGPAQIGFDAAAFVNSQPGWLKTYKGFVGEQTRTGGELVQYIAELFSVSPQLLLAIIEYQTGGLTQEEPTRDPFLYPLGYRDGTHRGLTNQLLWLCDLLNDRYYRWRLGKYDPIDLPDGRMERPDPWQNAATYALQVYFSLVSDIDEYTLAVSGEGLAKTYTELFGDPWTIEPHIPGSLRQPPMRLPFHPGAAWAYTGGPHTGWGASYPYSAIDFAPPSVSGGCSPTSEPATAVADGVVARTRDASLFLDLDGDGDIRTGWVVFYLHLANDSLVRAGTVVTTGDPLGLPSCEGGKATGTHVHIARLYNGEWIPAGSGVLPFDLEGWLAVEGDAPYQGQLVRFDQRVRASTGSDRLSHIQASAP